MNLALFKHYDYVVPLSTLQTSWLSAAPISSLVTPILCELLL